MDYISRPLRESRPLLDGLDQRLSAGLGSDSASTSSSSAVILVMMPVIATLTLTWMERRSSLASRTASGRTGSAPGASSRRSPTR